MKWDQVGQVGHGISTALLLTYICTTRLECMLKMYQSEPKVLHDPWVWTIITMWVNPSVRMYGYQLVKLSKTLEPHGIFYHILRTYACQYSLTIGMQNRSFYRHGFAEQLSSLLWSASENPHNSWTLWDICIKYCILIYSIIVQPLVCKTVARVVEVL